MKIICIPDNYEVSAKIKPVSKNPVYFLKPESALLINNYPFFIPEHAQQIISQNKYSD